MNMLRFMAIEANKEQPVRTGNSAYRWHGDIIGETPANHKRPRPLSALDWNCGPFVIALKHERGNVAAGKMVSVQAMDGLV